MPPTRVPAQAPAGRDARTSRVALLTLVATAVVIVFGAFAGQARALSLGRIDVLSALGEPLRAEISVTEVSAAEAEGLRVGIASSEAFRIAGIPYNAALADVRATLRRRGDGRYAVQLTSSRGMSDPFVDLLLEADSSTGRVARDYTVLLDPPGSRPVASSRPAMADRRTVPRQADTMPARDTAAAGERQRIAVRRGDTASRIADAHRPADVSLDQMLVALLRANPDAFIGGDMNRIRAGAVLNLPDASAGALPTPDAARTVVAQSRDFGEDRRKRADNAPDAGVAPAGRQSSGKLQARVEDRSVSAASPDRLTIAQGRAADDRAAQARQTQENTTRLATLSNNIGELNRLQTAGADAVPPALPIANGASATAMPETAGLSAASATLAAAAVPATSSAPATPEASPANGVSAAGAPAPALVSPSPTVTDTGTPAATTAPRDDAWYVELFNNPIFLGAMSLVVLVLGWLVYRLVGRRRQEAGDSVFLESRLPKDSFFAGSGGESVDTKNRANSIVSSLSYSPSHLDSGDVDPVAEADVYLAYGRDLQAEEILREALRVNPERTAIHLKLLEIHAKRRDLRAYETLATDMRKLTGGNGVDWSRVVEMGKELDPGNPLYEISPRQPMFTLDAAVPTTPISPPSASATSAGNVGSARSPAVPSPAAKPYAAPPPAFVPTVAPLDFDLDLDRPDAQVALDSEWITAGLPTGPTPLSKPTAAPSYEHHPPTIRDEPRVLPPPPPPSAPLPSIDLDNDFNTEPAALEMPSAKRGDPITVRGDLPRDSGFIEFDMSAFTGLRNAEHADTEAGGLRNLDSGDARSDSPHAIKLSLALELHALGDTEGARSLMEEVAAESTGDLQAQARQLLAKLD